MPPGEDSLHPTQVISPAADSPTAAPQGDAGLTAGQITGQSGQQDQPPPSQARVADVARELGYDLSQFSDERQALTHLVDRARQADSLRQLAEYGQRYLQAAPDFERYLAERGDQAGQRAAPAEAKSPSQKYWEAPPWDPSWATQLQFDDDGTLVGRPGTSPEVVAKAQRYLQYRREQQERCWNNPYQYFEPFIRDLIEHHAGDLVQKHLGQYQQETQARTFLDRHSSELWTDGPGGRQLTPLGREFETQVKWLASIGVPVAEQGEAAMKLARAAFPAQQSQSPSAANDEIKRNFLHAAAGYQPNAAGTLNPSSSPSNAPPQNPNLPLVEQLRQAFRQNGVTDLDLRGAY